MLEITFAFADGYDGHETGFGDDINLGSEPAIHESFDALMLDVTNQTLRKVFFSNYVYSDELQDRLISGYRNGSGIAIGVVTYRDIDDSRLLKFIEGMRNRWYRVNSDLDTDHRKNDFSTVLHSIKRQVIGASNSYYQIGIPNSILVPEFKYIRRNHLREDKWGKSDLAISIEEAAMAFDWENSFDS